MSKDNLGKITKVKVELGNGESHEVECTMGVLIRYQMATGKNVFKKSDMEMMSPMDYVMFLACAIYKDEPEKKMRELSEKVSGMAVSTVMEIVSNIFEQGEVESKKDPAQRTNPAK